MDFAENFLDLKNKPPLYLTVYNGKVMSAALDDNEYDSELHLYGFYDFYDLSHDSVHSFVGIMNFLHIFAAVLPSWIFGGMLMHSICRKAATKKAFRETSMYTPKPSSALIEY
ncbi:MAG: hypothetical protein K2K57_05165 [Oscillospiraceae bacterium]|nr:hypothetical protein [Oscillospiraceae bacterium]